MSSFWKPDFKVSPHPHIFPLYLKYVDCPDQSHWQAYNCRLTLTAALLSLVLYLWGSPIGFLGSRISLNWISGFGILKQNPGEIRNWKYHGRWDAKKKISGLQDGMKFGVWVRGLENPIGDPLPSPEEENKACGEVRAHCLNSSW